MGNNRVNTLFAAKWPEDVAQRGFAPTPKCLITCMGDLKLKPQELAVLLNIIERCWKAGDKAWPSIDYIAKNIGRKDSATRVITNSLAKKKFMDKEQRYNTTDLYDLEPLARKLDEHMKQCRHTARKLDMDSHKSSSLDSLNTGDYLEPELTRTNNIKLNEVKDTYSNKPNKDNEIRFLELINKYTNSNYRYLPKEAKETIKLFSLEEIDKALQIATVDPWHRDKLQELSVSYLSRASTIDSLLSRSQSKELHRILRLKQVHEANMNNQAKIVDKEAVEV
jgi:hypothetical protein